MSAKTTIEAALAIIGLTLAAKLLSPTLLSDSRFIGLLLAQSALWCVAVGGHSWRGGLTLTVTPFIFGVFWFIVILDHTTKQTTLPQFIASVFVASAPLYAAFRLTEKHS